MSERICARGRDVIVVDSKCGGWLLDGERVCYDGISSRRGRGFGAQVLSRTHFLSATKNKSNAL
jgi:hypothetical protein